MKHVYYYKEQSGLSVVEVVVDKDGNFIKDRHLHRNSGFTWHWTGAHGHDPYRRNQIHLIYPNKTGCKKVIMKYLNCDKLPAPEAGRRWESPND